MTRPDMIKAALAGLAVVGAGTLVARNLLKPEGEQGLKGWFYDESEKKLYEAGVHSVPPLDGIGGEKGDGVRALMVGCKGDCGDMSKMRIAYLEKYAPPLKKLFDDLRAARAKGEIYEGEMPAREGNFVYENTLIRRVEDATWYTMASPEGKKIIDEWKGKLCEDGSRPRVCVP